MRTMVLSAGGRGRVMVEEDGSWEEKAGDERRVMRS